MNTASRLESTAKAGEILISHETYALVEDQIDCEDRGQIEVRGMAYPVATYAAIRQRTLSSKTNQKFLEARSGLHIEINRDSMTEEERSTALAALERAIKHVKA